MARTKGTSAFHQLKANHTIVYSTLQRTSGKHFHGYIFIIVTIEKCQSKLTLCILSSLYSSTGLAALSSNPGLGGLGDTTVTPFGFATDNVTFNRNQREKADIKLTHSKLVLKSRKCPVHFQSQSSGLQFAWTQELMKNICITWQLTDIKWTIITARHWYLSNQIP